MYQVDKDTDHLLLFHLDNNNLQHMDVYCYIAQTKDKIFLRHKAYSDSDVQCVHLDYMSLVDTPMALFLALQHCRMDSSDQLDIQYTEWTNLDLFGH